MIARNWMNVSGPINYNTLAGDGSGGNNQSAPDDGSTVFSTNVNPALLVEGTNVLAVEVHQSDLGSSDVWIDVELLGFAPIIRNQPPLVTLDSPVYNAYYLAPASITLTATASDASALLLSRSDVVRSEPLRSSTLPNELSVLSGSEMPTGRRVEAPPDANQRNWPPKSKSALSATPAIASAARSSA